VGCGLTVVGCGLWVVGCDQGCLKFAFISKINQFLLFCKWIAFNFKLREFLMKNLEENCGFSNSYGLPVMVVVVVLI
jgi:hypothetical protein